MAMNALDKPRSSVPPCVLATQVCRSQNKGWCKIRILFGPRVSVPFPLVSYLFVKLLAGLTPPHAREATPRTRCRLEPPLVRRPPPAFQSDMHGYGVTDGPKTRRVYRGYRLSWAQVRCAQSEGQHFDLLSRLLSLVGSMSSYYVESRTQRATSECGRVRRFWEPLPRINSFLVDNRDLFLRTPLRL